MTGMLASVNSIEEALEVLAAQVDIIDLKQPAHGALGALDTDVVQQIVEAIGQRCLVSATIGDLPMQPELVYFATQIMAQTGVDYIKIGFFPDGDWPTMINKLSALTPQHNLIAVLFADASPDLSLIKLFKRAGFKGVMLDTMTKNRGSLTKAMDVMELRQFIRLAKRNKLLCGLAGSLRLTDIPGLMILKPDYLGFRGALCVGNKRTAQLNGEAITLIKQAINPVKPASLKV